MNHSITLPPHFQPEFTQFVQIKIRPIRCQNNKNNKPHPHLNPAAAFHLSGETFNYFAMIHCFD